MNDKVSSVDLHSTLKTLQQIPCTAQDGTVGQVGDAEIRVPEAWHQQIVYSYYFPVIVQLAFQS